MFLFVSFSFYLVQNDTPIKFTGRSSPLWNHFLLQFVVSVLLLIECQVKQYPAEHLMVTNVSITRSQRLADTHSWKREMSVMKSLLLQNEYVDNKINRAPEHYRVVAYRKTI